MVTKINYEKIILKEVKGIPIEALPQVIKILISLRNPSVWLKQKKRKEKSTSLCGLWKDSRNADEIIEDIYSHRTRFSGRDIAL